MADWLFKDEAPVTPEMQACIDRTNEAIREAGPKRQQYVVKLAARPSITPEQS
jgi:hypothetical protein